MEREDNRYYPMVKMKKAEMSFGAIIVFIMLGVLVIVFAFANYAPEGFLVKIAQKTGDWADTFFAKLSGRQSEKSNVLSTEESAQNAFDVLLGIYEKNYLGGKCLIKADIPDFSDSKIVVSQGHIRLLNDKGQIIDEDDIPGKEACIVLPTDDDRIGGVANLDSVSLAGGDKIIDSYGDEHGLFKGDNLYLYRSDENSYCFFADDEVKDERGIEHGDTFFGHDGFETGDMKRIINSMNKCGVGG